MEVKQAVEELLPMWTEIDTDDALELLGPSTVDSRVRAFAVKQLARADDDVGDISHNRIRLNLIHPGTYVISVATGASPQV